MDNGERKPRFISFGFKECCLIIGFGLFHGWIITFINYVSRLSPNLEGFPVPLCLFFVAGISASVLYILLPQSFTRRLDSLRNVLVIVSPCLVLISFYTPSVLSSLLCSIGCGLMLGFLHCSYGLATLELPRSSYMMIICLSTIIASVIAGASHFFMAWFSMPLLQVFILVIIQIGAGFLLREAYGSERSPGLPAVSFATESPGIGSFWRLMAAILIFGTMCRACDTFSFSPSTTGLPLFVFLLASHIIAALFLILLVVSKTKSLSISYSFALPCAGLGFIILALPIDFLTLNLVLSILLFSIGFEVINITAWVLTSYAAKNSSKPARYFGWYASVTYLGMFFGMIAQGVIISNQIAAAFIGLVCIVILVAIAFIVLPDQKIKLLEGSIEVAEMASSEENAFIASCHALAVKYSLTKRETEVLELLARGRTMRVITEKLVLSKGTVSTHIANIYRKTNIHRQQDLIDLVDKFR